jgi:hypothetical protein
METEATHEIRSAGEPGDACAMVIFGASGDLTKRKLIPALYNLAKDNLLSRDFALVGFARPEMSHEQFRDKCTEEVKQFATGQVDADLWHWFVRRLTMSAGILPTRLLTRLSRPCLQKPIGNMALGGIISTIWRPRRVSFPPAFIRRTLPG